MHFKLVPKTLYPCPVVKEFDIDPRCEIDEKLWLLSPGNSLLENYTSQSEECLYMIFCLVAIGQEHVLLTPSTNEGKCLLPCSLLYTCIQNTDLDSASLRSDAFVDDSCVWAAGESEALCKLCRSLQRVESFYDSIGGLLGYQLKCLEMILASAESHKEASGPPAAGAVVATRFHMPQGLNIAGIENRRAAASAAATGLEALPYMAEILPLGGETANHLNS